MILKDQFKSWLKKIVSERSGELYKESTINNYCTSLGKLVKVCNLQQSIGYNSIYNITTYDEFKKVKDKILIDSKYIEKNKEGKNSMQSALKLYERYLIELADPFEKIISFDFNRIFFGAPGTGKSYLLNKEKDILLNNNILLNIDYFYERVTFHPDYSYAQFVGTYKPIVDDSQILYKYVPGPFLRTYVKAMKSLKMDKSENFLLIIEEINRADVAAVFGDIFQLLDRNEFNESEYPIHTTEDIRKYLSIELEEDITKFSQIKIPNNMYIWATMNSADQGVFPMDTAFKRRWDFTYLGIDEKEDEINNYKIEINGKEYIWDNLRKAINYCLLHECKVNEDKLIGPFFISKKTLEKCEYDNDEFIKVFKSKVIMYLFDDAGKHKRANLFSGCNSYNVYSKICNEFEKRGIEIFSNILKERYMKECEN